MEFTAVPNPLTPVRLAPDPSKLVAVRVPLTYKVVVGSVVPIPTL